MLIAAPIKRHPQVKLTMDCGTNGIYGMDTQQILT